MKGHPYEFGFDLRLIPEKLSDPLTWRKPRRIFVNSMSDLFHPGVPDEYIIQVGHIMLEADRHTYQILTKRSERSGSPLNSKLAFLKSANHIWWGVSVEDRKHGLPRIDHFRAANVPVRFLSIEPLLENLGLIDLKNISWVIVGGESGFGARPMKSEWVFSIKRQCRQARRALLFQAVGRSAKERNGRTLAGRTYDELPIIA